MIGRNNRGNGSRMRTLVLPRTVAMALVLGVLGLAWWISSDQPRRTQPGERATTAMVIRLVLRRPRDEQDLGRRPAYVAHRMLLLRPLMERRVCQSLPLQHLPSQVVEMLAALEMEVVTGKEVVVEPSTEYEQEVLILPHHQ